MCVLEKGVVNAVGSLQRLWADGEPRRGVWFLLFLHDDKDDAVAEAAAHLALDLVRRDLVGRMFIHEDRRKDACIRTHPRSDKDRKSVV